MGQLSSSLFNKTEERLPKQKILKEDIQKSEQKAFFPRLSSKGIPEPLARPPLKRSYSSTLDGSVPETVKNIFSWKKRKLTHDVTIQYPFLDDSETSHYYTHSKIMIVLRGLPGCGKSTLAQKIIKKFPDGVICSADDFFMVDGKYKFRGECLKHAHQQCKQHAVNSVKTQVPIVVIDNTNLRLWQWDYYLKLANRFNYIPIVVEPKNEWRRDIASLSARNRHDLGVNDIIQKMSIFEEGTPLYFGWFLSDKDSYLVYQAALKCVESLLTQAPHISKKMNEALGITSFKEFADFFMQKNKMLHCTAKYLGHTDSDENKEYMTKVAVLDSIGKVSTLQIVGFVVTPRTFAAQVKLNSDQLQLWGNDDFEDIPEEFWMHEENDIENISVNLAPNDKENLVNKDAESQPQTDKESVHTKASIETDTDSLRLNLTEELQRSNIESPGEGNTAKVHDKSCTVDDEANRGETDVEIPDQSVEETQSANTTFDVAVSDVKSVDGSINDYIPITVDVDTTVDEWRKPDSPESLLRKCMNYLPKNTVCMNESNVKSTVNYSKYSDLISLNGVGSRAHMTLGCAEDIDPSTAGLDALTVVHAANREEELAPVKETIHCDRTSCQVKFYGHGLFVLSLYEKIEVKGLFNAFYSNNKC